MLTRALLLLMTLTTLASTAHAAFGEGKGRATNGADVELQNPLSAKARLQPSKVEAGGTTELIIDMNLAPGFHAYLERFKLAIESPDDLKLAPYKITPIVKFMDGATKTEKEGVAAGASMLKAIIEVPTGFKSGALTAHVKLTYQACTNDHCLFPKNISLEVPLEVTGSAPAAAAVTAVAPVAPQQGTDFENALNKGTLSAFLLVFVVGFLTSLTPCVYPMIPITLAVLGARAKNQSHLKNFSLALVYVLGIALTYACLGLLAASTGSLFGSALSNIYVVSGIAILFIAMSLSMFGVFEIQAPGFIRNKLGAAKTTSGYGGAFATGLIAGIVASPCIGPVLVGLLAWIAQSRSLALGFFLLFTFAVGMGLPFIVLGLSSSWISKLPKAGSWMDSVKYLFGILMIGMAFFYIKPLYPMWLFNALLGLALVLFASAFGAYEPVTQLTTTTRLRKGLMTTLLTVGVALTAFGVLSKLGFSTGQLAAATSASAPKSAMNWQKYSEAAYEAASKSGKPVLIDFTAEWCGACKEMESTVFVEPRIIEASQKFALLQIDGTEDTPELQKVITKFGVQGFPTYLFQDAKGQIHKELTVLGHYPAEDFQRNMDAVTPRN